MPLPLYRIFAYRVLQLFIAMLISTSASASALTAHQQQYLEAREALSQERMADYQSLRHTLKGYPLTPYLDFHANIDDILSLDGSTALTAIASFQDTPLYQTARYRYLMAAGKQKRWQDFLLISPDEPNNLVLQCYFYRAQRTAGKLELAYKGASKLWLHGRSRPKECDPLFTEWEKAGYRTQDLIWSRMLLAFNAGEYGLLKFLAKKVTTHKSDAQRLLSVYKDPRTLRHSKPFLAKANINADIVDAGIRRLAKKDLNKAVKLYLMYQKADRFSDHQGRKLSRYLIKRALIRQEDSLQSFIDSMLPLLDSDDLVELRLRWAIRQADKEKLPQLLTLLTPEKQQKARWQYWLTKYPQHTNALTQQGLVNLAQQRNFYGFSAADTLSLEFQLGHQTTLKDAEIYTSLDHDAGLARVEELLAIDKTIDARAEWVLMLNRHPKAVRAQYGLLAQARQWHDLGVQASIQAQLWNDMTMRFPYAADKAFKQASQQVNVDINEIRAIARRESAFYPWATSGVGARGLMQLMPATAKETAKKSKLKYRGQKSLYDIDINTQLGSRYYKRLLEQFNGNRVLATAAYNAGPHRVKRWLAVSDGQLDVMSFIESIPFTETREYVQAVLSYRIIYQIKQQQPPQLFSEQELAFRY
ncbi:lytic transglycosylase [Shewanella colwelliana]|uniref:Lytic transglycosylase n=1 Tax=Shewanella colwelliana TaxID=23 RepID=A0A1E5J150_SHECO|nr:transglycosylase SLT domain-containing protein [Shewanella colwelliana]OEG75838.1 lytic transglycosylase [Shewanella colwelliana]